MKRSLLKETRRAGLYHLPATRRGDLLEQAAHMHQTVLQADVGACKDAHQTLRELGKAFAFPAWYGANLDALHDCLTDPDWQPATSLVLLISGLDTLRHSAPDTFSTLLEVLRSAAEIRSSGKQPLWVLLSTPAPGVTDLPEA